MISISTFTNGYSIERYVEIALALKDLQSQGLIKHLSLTNFATKRLKEIKEAGIDILTNQIQYSALDKRAEKSMNDYCIQDETQLLAYSTVAGGLLSSLYQGIVTRDEATLSQDRSQIKYSLSVSEIAMAYILQKQAVVAIIVGARNSNHIESLTKASNISILPDDIALLDSLVSEHA